MAPGEAVELGGWRSNSLAADSARGLGRPGVNMRRRRLCARPR
jgi:hypothetical protein